MPLTFQEFEYQGELPEARTEGEVACVRTIEDGVVDRRSPVHDKKPSDRQGT